MPCIEVENLIIEGTSTWPYPLPTIKSDWVEVLLVTGTAGNEGFVALRGTGCLIYLIKGRVQIDNEPTPLESNVYYQALPSATKYLVVLEDCLMQIIQATCSVE